MKKLIGIFCVLALLSFSKSGAQTILLEDNFSNTGADGTWETVNGGTNAGTTGSLISGTGGYGSTTAVAFNLNFSSMQLYYDAALDLTGLANITLDYTITGTPSDALAIALLDTGSNIAYSYSLSSLPGGSITIAFADFTDIGGGVALNQIQGWALGAAGGSVNITMDNLQFTTAIPEPSTFALLGLGAAALYILRRKQK
jgi:hypothetical protein